MNRLVEFTKPYETEQIEQNTYILRYQGKFYFIEALTDLTKFIRI